MKQKITDDLLRDASQRFNNGETLSSIAAALGVPLGTLKSAKRRKPHLWRKADASEKRTDASADASTIASPPVSEAEIRELRAKISALEKQLDNASAKISYLELALEREKLAYRQYREHVSL